MDKRCMLIWAEQIFAPHLLANPLPLYIQPVVLLLDAYQCHIMQLVVLEIMALGVEVIHIPGRCTGLCQSLDIIINNLFKHLACLLWEEWMMMGVFILIVINYINIALSLNNFILNLILLIFNYPFSHHCHDLVLLLGESASAKRHIGDN